MITSLSIRDFQSIRSLDAECGLITVFYGESDAGKSAIVRALRGLAFNDWPADHVTEGRVASHVGVKVAVAGEGEFLVGARKGSGANEYLLEAPTGDRQEYGRVGRGVPEAVVELLGWREMELDDGTRFTPSFLAQFDEPFLVGTSPIKAAKILGGLTNIATLYAAIRDGANEERQARRGAEEAQLRVSEGEPALVAVESDLRAAEELYERADRLVDSAQVCKALWQDRVDLVGRLREARGIEETAAAAVSAAEEAVGRVTDLSWFPAEHETLVRCHEISRLYMEAARVVRSLEVDLGVHERAEAEALEALEQFKTETGVCPVCEKPW